MREGARRAGDGSFVYQRPGGTLRIFTVSDPGVAMRVLAERAVDGAEQGLALGDEDDETAAGLKAAGGVAENGGRVGGPWASPVMWANPLMASIRVPKAGRPA